MKSKTHNRLLENLARTARVAPSKTDEAIRLYLQSLDSPRSLAVWLLYSSKEHDQLVALQSDPLWYNSPEKFRDDYLASNFLSKADFLKLSTCKEAEAMRKFFEYEELCNQTNLRFKSPLLDPKYHGSNVWLLSATTRKIEQILGCFTGEEFVDQANWGPGVTTLLKGSHVSSVNKFHSENGITSRLKTFIDPWFALAYPGWSEHLYQVVPDRFVRQDGNSITTVPKNSKTDRVIAIEPGINLFFQKSIGSMIRRRLSRWGINLNDQRNNQDMASRASVSGSHATVDFSSASDSIAYKVVEALLPPAWFALMESCRSPIGHHNSSTLKWNKFSSMGNGFTFELESLIFFASALAVAEYTHNSDEISVYGDDVVIPTQCYDLYSSFCDFLGFRVNHKKSFSSSAFRESCGSHFFDGVNCKPIFLKERLQNVQTIYKLANNVRRVAHRYGFNRSCDRKFEHCFYRLRSWVPKPLRLCCPADVGDVGFISNFDEAHPRVPRHGIEGYLFKALFETGIAVNFEGTGTLLSRLWDLRNHRTFVPCFHKEPLTQGYKNSYTLRSQTKLSSKDILVRHWYNLGPWS